MKYENAIVTGLFLATAIGVSSFWWPESKPEDPKKAEWLEMCGARLYPGQPLLCARLWNERNDPITKPKPAPGNGIFLERPKMSAEERRAYEENNRILREKQAAENKKWHEDYQKRQQAPAAPPAPPAPAWAPPAPLVNPVRPRPGWEWRVTSNRTGSKIGSWPGSSSTGSKIGSAPGRPTSWA